MRDKVFIVCGYGSVGRKTCKSLEQKYNPYIIVIDKNLSLTEKIFKDGYDAYYGDAVHSQTLLEAKIKQADGIICTFSDDDKNALCIITAKWLNPEITIASRANKYQSIKKLKLAGASKVAVFSHLKNYFSKLPANNFKVDLLISYLTSFEKNPHISEITAVDNSFLQKKQVINIKEIADVNIIALKKIDGNIITNPSIHETIEINDVIVLLSEKEQIQYLRAELKRLSSFNTFSRIIEELFVKRFTLYWISALLLFDYFVMFDNFLNWIVLPAPPFTVGHLIFSIITGFIGLLLLKIRKRKQDENTFFQF